jgi:predicted deacetylase
MACRFQVSSKIHDALLATNMNINHEHKNKVRISNLKTTQKLGIISEEEFRAQVRTCLHM